jgi:pimeloyl-ACP methyl ester carboxylesterase
MEPGAGEASERRNQMQPQQPQVQLQAQPARPGQPAGAYVPANGIQIYYEVSGNGEPLLLLHGGAGSPASWADDVLIFSQQFRVFALDLRGQGRSVNPTGELNYSLMAQDVLAFCAALGLRQPFLCGHSDGGNVALELAIRHAALPRALVLSGVASAAAPGSAGGAGVYTALLKQYLGSSRLPAPQDLARLEQGLPDIMNSLRTLRDALQHPDSLKSLVAQTVQTWNAPLGYQPEDLKLVAAPALVLLGDRDELLPVEEAVSLYRALPGAELAIVPNTGHGFSPYMRSLAFDFLRRQRDGAMSPAR